MKRGDLQGLVFFLGMLVLLFGLALFLPKAEVRQDIVPLSMNTAAIQVGVPTSDGVPVTYTLESSGFVSLHRAMGDAPGEILGQVYVPAGEGTVTVPTSGALGPAIVLLFADDGDGVFSVGNDRPIVRDGASVRAEVVLSSPAL